MIPKGSNVDRYNGFFIVRILNAKRAEELQSPAELTIKYSPCETLLNAWRFSAI